MITLKKISYFVPILSVCSVFLLIITGNNDNYEPRFLLSILNTIFLGILPAVMAVLSFVIYRRTNLVNTLLFGCGMLVFALGSTMAGWLRYLPGGANMTVTIHNTSALAASIFHLIGAYKDDQKNPLKDSNNLAVLGFSLLGIIIFISMIFGSVHFKIMPPFFDENGPTFLRQGILGSSIAFFFASSVLFTKLYQRQRLDYHYWYSATLCLYAIGMFSASVQASVGSMIGWIGRFDQYIGGLFALVSFICFIKKTKLQRDELFHFAEEFFVDAERSYRELVESSCDAIITVDQKLDIFFINKAALELFDFGSENPVGVSFIDLIFSQKEKSAFTENMESINQLKKRGFTDGVRETEAVSRAGRVFPISVSSTTRELNSGLACTFIIRDISLARLAQMQTTELAQSLQRQVEFERMVKCLANDFINIPLEKIGQAINQGLSLLGDYCSADRIAIYHYDWGKGIVSLENEWVSEEQFRTKDECRQIPLPHICSEVLEGRKTDDRYESDMDNDRIENLASNGAQIFLSVPLMVNHMAIGFCMICKMKDMQMWSQASLAIISLFCEMLSNVYHRMQYEHMLVENNETMSLLLNATSDGIGMLDKQGTILSVNTQFASRFGKDPKDMIGICFHELIPSTKYGDLFEQRLSKINKVFETRQPELFEDSRDGLWFFNRAYPVQKEGAVIAAALFSTDITHKMKAMEEERKRAEYETKLKVQTDFFTNLSHEFKTPLTLMLLQLELMKSYTSNNNGFGEGLHTLMKNTYRLARLVGNFLDINKLDAGYMTVDLHYLDIVSLVKDITYSIQAFAKTKSINVRFESKLLGYHMAADKDKMERIMLNLLSNAIKFSNNGGTICVTVRGKKNSILIIVSDTGIGIPKDKQAYIFNRFAQVDTSLSRKTEGSGIGLSLIKSLVELLKGKIWVASKPGMGSRFYVELPAQEIDENMFLPEVNEHGLTQRVQMELSDIY